MKQADVNNALDKALDEGFATPTITSVSMTIPDEMKLPATAEEQKNIVKTNLYNMSNKLMAVLDFYVNNVETMVAPEATSLIRLSPASEICSLAREIGILNDKLYKYAQTNQEVDNTKKDSNNIHQTNIIIKGGEKENKPVSLADIDQMIKDGKI